MTKATLLIIAGLIFTRVDAGNAAGTPAVQALVNQFSPVNYQNLLVNRLYTRQGMNRACDYGVERRLCQNVISNEFRAAGLTPVIDRFAHQSPYSTATLNSCNVIAVKPGRLYPDEIYVVSAHYDSVDNPGADDDASGVACLLEMARIFAPHDFARTIVFCAFDAEELLNHPGSLRYVSQHLTNQIKGMISLDMIAHQSSGVYSNLAYIEGRPTVVAIRNDLKAAIEAYGDGLVPYQSPNDEEASDHGSFLNAGFQACRLTEAEHMSNPYHHKLTDYVDMPGNIDWTYAGKMCKCAIGYFATQLGPLEIKPTAVSLVCHTNRSATVCFSGFPGYKYATELCTNLAMGFWTVVETNTASLTNGTFITLDPQAGNRNSSFYRARLVPPN